MMKYLLIVFGIVISSFQVKGQQTNTLNATKLPIMGWASWNNFRVNINEEIIKAQADCMVSLGLKKEGYCYINIDDGFFGGRDSFGNLIPHKVRFPNGMKNIADYIHSKGLKAGIYSDAGINTCSTVWDKDTIGCGTGLMGHDWQDINLMLNNWGFDFLKVDWCGGDWLGLNEQVRYTEIGKIINAIKPSAQYNICRWQFPGEWAITIADSWRISGDINPTFESIVKIIDINENLWKYCSFGHYNDMDMLQVGRGMTYEEDKAHFSMWCIMNSPLLLGNDLRSISKQTLEIISNSDVIALNQDSLAYQARKIIDLGDIEVFAKPLKHSMSGKVAVAILNKSNQSENVTIDLNKLGINPQAAYSVRDLWTKKEFVSSNKSVSFKVPTHGVVVLKIVGIMMPFNVFQTK